MSSLFHSAQSLIFTALLSIFQISIASAQSLPAETHEHHDRYCRHYPEEVFVPKFAWRNDWQSPLVHKYDVTFYHLDINVSHTSVAVGGTVHIHGRVVAPVLDTFAFELITVQNISQIVFNGVTASNYSRVGDNVLVPVNPLMQGQNFVASITYQGTPPTGGFFSGVSNAYNSQYQKSVTWTLSEPFAAKDWFPVKQDLNDKADSVWVFITSPAGTKAGSQGLLTNVVSLPDGRVRHEWKSRYPIAYYLISFAVSDYQDYSIYAKPQALAGDSILVQNYIYNHPNYLPQQKSNIDKVVPMIELYSDLFTLYPFHQEKYGHAITQLGGGMEHQTMSTMGSFSFNLVAHELGHMWFGDNVTCATWSDIWINEGFATYSNYLAQYYINGPQSGNSFMVNTQNNVMSQPGGSVYVPPSEVNPNNIWRIFNGRLSYDKGAAIIHVLRHEINNDSLFFAVLQTFQTQFKDSTATGDDFRMVAEAVTGMNLVQFFDQWYYGEGYPRYAIAWWMEGNNLRMNVTQTTSSSTPLFKMTMSYRINFTDGSSEMIRLFQENNVMQFSIPVSKQVSSITVDPDNWTFEQVTGITVGNPERYNEAFFSLGPNPAQGTTRVYLPVSGNKYAELTVFDNSGKKIFATRLLPSDTTYEIAGLRPGVYFVRLNRNGVSHIEKLVMLQP
ncbi:MAG: T9SS type A sorting domain-containing protein [Bacteroidetes bacterium]|nr:T9SS type A sorting domain-containing protein [Bacteroidota bacterium]